MAYLIIALFLLVIAINVKALADNTAVPFYDTNIFRNYFPFKESFQIRHPNNNTEEENMTVDGFQGIYKKPTSSYSRGIDTISLRIGRKDCKDSGYTNSTGYLCLTEDEQKLLNTRGGNDN